MFILWLTILCVIVLICLYCWQRWDRRQTYNRAEKPTGWGDDMPWKPHDIGDDRFFYTVVITIGIVAVIVIIALA